MIKTTVIIPNYNGKAYLEKCIESVKNQTVEVDIIVVDNASTDDSLEYLESLPVKLIKLGENTGFSNAVNVGIQSAVTPYVFLLNNDTECENDAIERLERAMEQNKRVFSVQAMMVSLKNKDIVDDSGDYYCALGMAFTLGKDRNKSRFNRIRKITSACAGAALYNKKAFDEIGFFDVAHFCYLEDVDIGYRARLYGYTNLIEPKAVVYHAGSATSGSRYNPFKQRLSAGNNIYFLWKNMPLFQLLINFPLLLLGIGLKGCFFLKKGLGKPYFQGISEGLKKIKDNPDKKIKFTLRRLLYYVKIQMELWYNTIIKMVG